MYVPGAFTVNGLFVSAPVEFRHPLNLYVKNPFAIVSFSVGLMAAPF
jgi:hypothetical protein